MSGVPNRLAPAWVRKGARYVCGKAQVYRQGAAWIALRPDGSRQVFSYFANAKKWAVES